MKIRMLALDLDDTLLDGDFGISRQNRSAIQRARQHGVLVTLATGRMFRSALPFAAELGIDLPLITYHGALIRTACGGETLLHRPVPLETAREVAGFCAARGFHVNAYIDDQLYVAQENEYSRYYQSIAAIPVTVTGDLVSSLISPPTKLTVINRDGLLPGLMADLKVKWGEKLAIALSRPHFLEITDRGATKGQALAYLAALHRIDRSETAAIGDSYNDIDMLRFAGVGVAVANAPEEVKAAADLVTAANTEHGVAVFINRYLLGGKDDGSD